MDADDMMMVARVEEYEHRAQPCELDVFTTLCTLLNVTRKKDVVKLVMYNEGLKLENECIDRSTRDATIDALNKYATLLDATDWKAVSERNVCDMVHHIQQLVINAIGVILPKHGCGEADTAGSRT